jgi:hypothetical protein
MTMRLGMFSSVLLVGLMALPSHSLGFDPAGQLASTHCATTHTTACTPAPLLLGQANVLPVGIAIPVPLPRPPDLNAGDRDIPAPVCNHSRGCR